MVLKIRDSQQITYKVLHKVKITQYSLFNRVKNINRIKTVG